LRRSRFGDSFGGLRVRKQLAKPYILPENHAKSPFGDSDSVLRVEMLLALFRAHIFVKGGNSKMPNIASVASKCCIFMVTIADSMSKIASIKSEFFI
jgi:hypothetical protein